jgi:ESX secretion-associated protein EspG
MSGSYSLSLAAVDILSQTLNVNLRLFPFEIPSFGRLQEDRVRIARAVFDDLSKRGLIRGREIDPDLTLALRTLARFQIAVAAMGTLDESRQLFARASATAETGVLAVQDGQKIRIQEIRPTALAAAMVGLLPRMEAGPGQSVTLTKPVATVAARDGDEDYFGGVHTSTLGRPTDALRLVEGYLARPRTGSGFFAVTGRDRYGKEIRAGELGWYDTDAGRYLNLSQPPGDDGQIHNSFAPADSTRLTRQLNHLIESVA